MVEKRKKWPLSVRLGLLAAVSLLVFVAMRSWFTPPVPPGPVEMPPNPNSWSELVEANAMFSENRPDLNKQDLAEYAAWVALNRVALDRTHAALSRPCKSPADLSDVLGTRRVKGASESLAYLGLAKMLTLEGTEAEMRRDLEVVAKVGTSLLTLGQAVPSHGALVDHIFAGAVQNTAVRLLGASRMEFDRSTCSNLLARVVAHDAGQIDYAAMTAWERYYANLLVSQLPKAGHNSASAWWFFVAAKLPGSRHWRGVDETLASYERTRRRDSARLRMLAVELALRLHVLDHGRPPSSLADLVPQYLVRLPVDPFSTDGLIYKTAGEGWVIYSVGPDGKDDGGVPVADWMVPAPLGDVILNDKPTASKAVAP